MRQVVAYKRLKQWKIPGGYSIYPWVGRYGAASHTLTLFKTNIADFPTLFKTEFRFFDTLFNTFILFKTKIDKSIPWLTQKMINSIPCLRQKSRKTYPGWPHVPIKPLRDQGVSPREKIINRQAQKVVAVAYRVVDYWLGFQLWGFEREILGVLVWRAVAYGR